MSLIVNFSESSIFFLKRWICFGSSEIFYAGLIFNGLRGSSWHPDPIPGWGTCPKWLVLGQGRGCLPGSSRADPPHQTQPAYVVQEKCWISHLLSRQCYSRHSRIQLLSLSPSAEFFFETLPVEKTIEIIFEPPNLWACETSKKIKSASLFGSIWFTDRIKFHNHWIPCPGFSFRSDPEPSAADITQNQRPLLGRLGWLGLVWSEEISSLPSLRWNLGCLMAANSDGSNVACCFYVENKTFFWGGLFSFIFNISEMAGSRCGPSTIYLT